MAEPGSIVWVDLTVPEADELRDFYTAVVGWEPEGQDMGGYEDFNMKADGKPQAGVCHARGANAQLPPQWLVYVQVADLDQSLDACHQRGGKVVDGPRKIGTGRFACIEDPAGAIMALIQL